MSKCGRCRTRKAKRACGALGQSICSLCCGQIREKEIHCPADCPFLSKHKSYQEKRVIEKKATPKEFFSREEEDPLRDEKLAWMAFHIEAPLNDYAEKESSFNDREALLTLEYAREKIAKGKGLVIMPGKTGLPQNELGEAIYHMIERCRFEGRIILTGKPLAYSTDEKLRVLDRLIGTLKHLAAGNIEGRAYIQAVAMRFAELKGRGSPSKKVFTIT